MRKFLGYKMTMVFFLLVSRDVCISSFLTCYYKQHIGKEKDAEEKERERRRRKKKLWNTFRLLPHDQMVAAAAGQYSRNSSSFLYNTFIYNIPSSDNISLNKGIRSQFIGQLQISLNELDYG